MYQRGHALLPNPNTNVLRLSQSGLARPPHPPKLAPSPAQQHSPAPLSFVGKGGGRIPPYPYAPPNISHSQTSLFLYVITTAPPTRSTESSVSRLPRPLVPLGTGRPSTSSIFPGFTPPPLAPSQRASRREAESEQLGGSEKCTCARADRSVGVELG